MRVPQVVIVGRPNVGKSSLFNMLAGRRIAIVDPTPGVTRDRLSAPVKIGERYVEIVDTGGMGIADVDNLTAAVEQQIDYAIEQADLLLFVVDIRAGPTPLDEEIARRLRAVDKPLLLLANKCDFPELEAQAVEFYQLGFERIICVSAHHHRAKADLLDRIVELLPGPTEETADAEPPLKLAIVGRRNTGKSTFINCLAQEERTIVSEVAGTTRDSIDVHFQRDGKSIIAIDTAGVRYKGHIHTDVEFYSLARAERSIRRADVVLHFFAAQDKVSMVDKQLAGYILEQYKPAIFVVNKWDLLRPNPTGIFADYLRQVFPSLDYLPIAFTTAKTGKNVQTVVNLAQNLFKQASVRVGTGELNRVVRRAVLEQSPPSRQNRQPRIYYATQVGTQPPTIVIMTNGPQLFDNTYQRYLLKTFRDHLPFKDVPIKMYLRQRGPGGGPQDDDQGGDEVSPKKSTMGKKRPRKARGKKTGGVWEDV